MCVDFQGQCHCGIFSDFYVILHTDFFVFYRQNDLLQSYFPTFIKDYKFKTHSITKTNELFYAGPAVVTNRLRVKIDKVAGRKEPMWKIKLQEKIKQLRKDLSQLEASKDKDISNFRHWERLERKYSIRVKRLNVVIEIETEDYCYCTKS